MNGSPRSSTTRSGFSRAPSRAVRPSARTSTSYPSRRSARASGSEMAGSSSASSTRVTASMLGDGRGSASGPPGGPPFGEGRHALGAVAAEGRGPPAGVLDLQSGGQVDVRARAASPAWPAAGRPASSRRSAAPARGPGRGRCRPGRPRRRSRAPAASGAGSRRAVKTREAARDQPTRRVSSWVPPPPGMTPTETSGSPTVAPLPGHDEVAGRARARTRRRARTPRPRRSRARAGRGPRRYAPRATGRCRTRSASVKALRSLRSAPTQNARSWLDRSTTQRTLGSAATRAVAAASAVAMAVETALRASGRSRTISTTWPSPSASMRTRRAGVGHRSSCRSGVAAGRRTGVPARVSEEGSTLPTPRKVRGRSGTRANPDTSCSDSATASSTSTLPGWAMAVRREARLTVVAEDVPQLGHHPARGQADAHVGEDLVDGDRLDEVERRRGGRRGVAVGEEDLVADRLDDAAAVGRHDVGAEHLEPLDDLGELALGRLADQGAERDEVGEPDVPVDALLGRLRLGVGEQPGDRVGEVPAPRIQRSGSSSSAMPTRYAAVAWAVAVVEWSAERSPVAARSASSASATSCTCQDASRSAVRAKARVSWQGGGLVQLAAPHEPGHDPRGRRRRPG